MAAASIKRCNSSIYMLILSPVVDKTLAHPGVRQVSIVLDFNNIIILSEPEAISYRVTDITVMSGKVIFGP